MDYTSVCLIQNLANVFVFDHPTRDKISLIGAAVDVDISLELSDEYILVSTIIYCFSLNYVILPSLIVLSKMLCYFFHNEKTIMLINDNNINFLSKVFRFEMSLYLLYMYHGNYQLKTSLNMYCLTRQKCK